MSYRLEFLDIAEDEIDDAVTWFGTIRKKQIWEQSLFYLLTISSNTL